MPRVYMRFRYWLLASFAVALWSIIACQTAYAEDISCPVIPSSHFGTIYKDPDTMELTIEAGLSAIGSNWWYFFGQPQAHVIEAKGVAIFDLQAFTIPDGAQVLLNLGDNGGKLCNDADGDCLITDPAPSPKDNKIEITYFAGESSNISVDDWGRSATSLAIIVTSSEQRLDSQVSYSLDVTSIVSDFINRGQHYLGFRFQPTQATDLEGFFRPELQIIATDPNVFVRDAFKPKNPKEEFEGFVRTQEVEISITHVLRENVNPRPTITAKFSPICGSERLSVATLAAALKIDHFNWLQTIEIPSNQTAYILDGFDRNTPETPGKTNMGNMAISCIVLGNSENSFKYGVGPNAGQNAILTPLGRKFLDPIVFKNPNQAYAIKVDGSQTNDVCWYILDPTAPDSNEPYMNEPEQIRLYTTEALEFEDAPATFTYSVSYAGHDQYLHFTTLLVGVNKAGEISNKWGGFHWQSNSAYTPGGNIVGGIKIGSVMHTFPGMEEIQVGSGDIYSIEVVSNTGLQLTPTSLNFTSTEENSNPPDRIITISDAISETLNWTATENIPWLTLSATSGTTSSTVTAHVDATGLANGTYTGTIQILSEFDSALFEVTLEVGKTKNKIYIPEIHRN